MRRIEASDHAAPMTETELQGHIIKMAAAQGWAIHVHSQGASNAPRRAVRVASNNGYPDMTLARDGEVLWLELKAQKGTLDPMQVFWQQALPYYEVIRPSDLARGRVDELLA